MLKLRTQERLSIKYAKRRSDEIRKGATKNIQHKTPLETGEKEISYQKFAPGRSMNDFHARQITEHTQPSDVR